MSEWHQHHNRLVCKVSACRMRPEVTAVFPPVPVHVVTGDERGDAEQWEED